MIVSAHPTPGRPAEPKAEHEAEPEAEPKKSSQEELDEALDQALKDTFPASDAIALLEPAPAEPHVPKH